MAWLNKWMNVNRCNNKDHHHQYPQTHRQTLKKIPPIISCVCVYHTPRLLLISKASGYHFIRFCIREVCFVCNEWFFMKTRHDHHEQIHETKKVIMFMTTITVKYDTDCRRINWSRFDRCIFFWAIKNQLIN